MTESQTAAPTATGAAGSAIDVEHIAPHGVDTLWQKLTTPDGVEALLGEGARLGGKGEPWHAADGTYGVTRSYHPGEQVRVSWHADANAPATLVDLQFAPHEEGTKLHLRHEHLGPDAPAEELRRRWEGALARFTADA
jgi:hypothetical protein